MLISFYILELFLTLLSLSLSLSRNEFLSGLKMADDYDKIN